MVRYGIIGTGMMGAEHIRNISLIEGAVVAGLVDTDSGLLSAAVELAGGHPAAFTRLGDLLREDICDAYVIVTPNDTHYDILLATLSTKKPILCEKPLCTDLTDCQKIYDKSKKSKVPIWVAMEYRYMPPIARMLRRIKDGEIGKPIMMSIREHRFPFLPKVGNWNRFNSRTGGTLVEKCCHYWDLMQLTLQSNPIRVFASAGSDVNHKDEFYDGRTPDIADNAFAIVDFANGTRGMLELCMFAEGGDWQEIITVVGSAGRLEARVPAAPRFNSGEPRHAEISFADRTFRPDVVELLPVDPKILEAGEHHGATFYQHLKFFEFVRSEGALDPEVSVSDGICAVQLGKKAELSASTGKSIEFH